MMPGLISTIKLVVKFTPSLLIGYTGSEIELNGSDKILWTKNNVTCPCSCHCV